MRLDTVSCSDKVKTMRLLRTIIRCVYLYLVPKDRVAQRSSLRLRVKALTLYGDFFFSPVRFTAFILGSE